MNLGNPVEFTIKGLAEIVVDRIGSSSRIVHRLLPNDDPKQWRPDITYACEQIGCEPSVALRDGSTRTIACFDELLKSRTRSG